MTDEIPTYEGQPGTAEIAARAGIEPSQVIRFDHNTSPFTPTWAADVASQLAANSNEYPAEDYPLLREAAAAYAGVAIEAVVPGAGIDELILVCATAFLLPHDSAVVHSPTYPLYRIATAQRAAQLTEIPMDHHEFAFPVARLAEAASRSKLTWLCVPNNPTGNALPDAELQVILDAAAGPVIIDAAYAEFGAHNWAEWVDASDNLVVLRTLSKGFSLAGIRVGYSISPPRLANALNAVRPPASISTTSAGLATRALNAGEPVATVAAITEARTELASKLRMIGFRVLPSDTNFLLCEVGPEALDLERRLMAEGLVVRCYHSEPLVEYLRITVRSPDENGRLLEGLARYLG